MSIIAVAIQVLKAAILSLFLPVVLLAIWIIFALVVVADAVAVIRGERTGDRWFAFVIIGLSVVFLIFLALILVKLASIAKHAWVRVGEMRHHISAQGNSVRSGVASWSSAANGKSPHDLDSHIPKDMTRHDHGDDAPASLPDADVASSATSPTLRQSGAHKPVPQSIQIAPPANLGQAAFDYREPDDPTDRVPHTDPVALPDTEPSMDGWAIVGASRRGFSHEHDGKYREDALKIEIVDGWHLAAVADGGGAYRLARVGANQAVAAGLQGIVDALQQAGSRNWDDPQSDSVIHGALLAGLQCAYDDALAEAKRRELDPEPQQAVKQMRTTILLLAHRQISSGHLVAAAQIGDGIIFARDERQGPQMLCIPDTGPTGNEVTFMTDVAPATWKQDKRVRIHRFPGPCCYFLAMTDGVADDFLPIEENLERLERPLFNAVLEGSTPAEAAPKLVELLGYQRAASFDDRTLVCIYQIGVNPWK